MTEAKQKGFQEKLHVEYGDLVIWLSVCYTDWTSSSIKDYFKGAH